MICLICRYAYVRLKRVEDAAVPINKEITVKGKPCSICEIFDVLTSQEVLRVMGKWKCTQTQILDKLC